MYLSLYLSTPDEIPNLCAKSRKKKKITYLKITSKHQHVQILKLLSQYYLAGVKQVNKRQMFKHCILRILPMSSYRIAVPSKYGLKSKIAKTFNEGKITSMKIQQYFNSNLNLLSTQVKHIVLGKEHQQEKGEEAKITPDEIL